MMIGFGKETKLLKASKQELRDKNDEILARLERCKERNVLLMKELDEADERERILQEELEESERKRKRECYRHSVTERELKEEIGSNASLSHEINRLKRLLDKNQKSVYESMYRHETET